MANPTILASGKAERGLSTASTSWTFTVTLPAGTNRLVLFVSGSSAYSNLGGSSLLTLKLGTTDFTAVSGGTSGTLTAIRTGSFYLDNPLAASSTTVTVTNATNDNGGGWGWLALQDCDLATAPSGFSNYAASASSASVSISPTPATGDLVLICSASYGGTTGTAGANTTVLQASIQNAQGGTTRSAFGYATGPNTPSITGWNTDQCCTVAVVNKGTVSGPTSATLTGPTTGTTGAASSSFTVTLDVAATSTVTITPAGTVGTVTFSPSSPTITVGNTSTTFTANADTDGTHSISITTSPTLTYSGSPISYVTTTPSGSAIAAISNTYRMMRSA